GGLLPGSVDALRFGPLDRVGDFEVARIALLLGRPPSGALDARARIAARFLSGHGLEIGALHNPLPLPPEAPVRYVDRLPVHELRTHYPELDGFPLVEPAVLAEADALTPVETASEAFVVCNHVLEHMRDPLGPLAEWLRVLQPGGHLYVSIPDRANPFDRLRERTSFDHLLQDRAGGGRRG